MQPFGQPQPGGGVRVEIEPCVEQRAVAAGQHVDRSAQLDEQVAVTREPGPEGRRDVVGQPCDDGDARAQAGARRDRRAHAADHLGRVADGAEQRRLHAGRRAQVGARTSRSSQVVEAAFQRPVALAVASVGELPGEPVVRARHAPRARPQLRLVPLQPAQLGAGRLLRDAGAGALQHSRVGQLGGQLVDLGVRARVVVEQRGPQRPVGVVEREHAGHAAGHADGGDGRRPRCRRRCTSAGRARARSRATRRRPAPTIPAAARPGRWAATARRAARAAGSRMTAFTAVVPRSRPSSTASLGQRSLIAATLRQSCCPARPVIPLALPVFR